MTCECYVQRPNGFCTRNDAYWCPHPDCLFQTAPLDSPQALEQHTAAAHAECAAVGLAAPTLFPCGAPLPTDSSQFSILSYNVLMPNSVDGWWLYKYYQPSTPLEHTEWHAREALLRQQLSRSRADVICLQEMAPESFESDFHFLTEQSYECILHSKGRMRVATFWRTERFSLLLVPKHGDRTLITVLQTVVAADEKQQTLFVVNCHLTAGPDAARRLRQMHDALELVRKTAQKLDISPADVQVVTCGDFNAGGDTAVRQLLQEQLVDSAFREPDQPDTVVTTKPKKNTVSPFKDCYEEYSSAVQCVRQPTMLVANLMDRMHGPAGGMSDQLCSLVTQMFVELSEGAATMNMQQVPASVARTGRESDNCADRRCTSG